MSTIYISLHSPLPPDSPRLHLTQRLTPTHKRHRSHHTRERQHLKQPPANIVHRKHPLHRHQAPKEQRMAHRRRTQRRTNMSRIPAQQRPRTKQHRQRPQHRERKEDTDHPRRARLVRRENMMNLRQLAVPNRLSDLRSALISAESDVENRSLGRGSGPEGAQHEGGGEGGRGE